jgi:predicted cobalt transporter CbtA
MMDVTCWAFPATEQEGHAMVRTLLIRGMLVGLVAGLLVFGFGKVFGEPAVEQAISFEAKLNQAKPNSSMAAEPELVSRGVQASYGLFTGVVIYCAAFGGLFALVFAFAHGRVSGFGPRGVSALLAGAGFIAIYLVPGLKYPANPPAVGDPDTIGYRTALYFLMITISIAAMIAAVMVRQLLLPRRGAWPASLTAAACYVVIVAIAQRVLPRINETPDGFSATALWDFRIASLGMQFVMWAVLGLLFGWLTERAMARDVAVGQRSRIVVR